MEYCILGDIGGTKCKLLLTEFTPIAPYRKKTIITKIYKTNEYSSLEEILSLFLKEYECQQKKPKYCTLAIAGPVKNNSIEKFANLNWNPVDGAKIKKQFNFLDCSLLNDFEAVGYSAASMKFEEFHSIHKAKRNNLNDKYLIVGQGTGMGVSYIINKDDEDNIKVLPSEAGHLPLGIHNERDYKLQRFIKKKLNKKNHCYVSQEYFLCGRGIPFLYEFLVLQKGEVPEENLDGRRVFELLSKDNPLTKEFLDIYLDYYGRSLDHLTKAFLPNGGNIVLGGIIFLFFQKFYNINNDLFFKKFRKYFFRDEVFVDIFNDVNIYIFSSDIAEFGLEGAFNQIILKVLKKPELKKEISSIQESELKNIPYNFYSNRLREKFQTFKGFITKKTRGSFLVKVRSLSKVQKLNIDGVSRLFKTYLIDSFDTQLQLVTPINGPEYYPDDILKLLNKDKLYYTEENGWYIFNKVNCLVFIDVDIFDELSTNYLKNKKIDCKFLGEDKKKKYLPKILEIKKTRNFSLDSFLKLNDYTKKIETNKYFFKIINMHNEKIFRYNRNKSEHFNMVILQTNNIIFKALIPKWTPIPKEPFYGFLILNLLFAPGFKRQYHLVLSENTIFASGHEFNDMFEDGCKMVHIEDMAKNKFPFIFK